MTKILHLLDDTNPGGVTRFLDQLQKTSHIAGGVRHVVAVVARGRLPKRLDADVIVSHLSVSWRTLPALTALRARAARCPLIHVEHSYSEGFVSECVRRHGRFQTLLSAAYALFDRVVAVSETQGAWLARARLVSPWALRIIAPITDLDPFLALAAPTGPAYRIGAIGRFDRQKGFDTLIDAFRATSNPALTLCLTGDGPERDALIARAADDARISFAPFTASPARAGEGLDIVAMPSRWEPYGLAALEARAASRTLLVSTVDGLEDHVRAGAIAVRGGVASWTIALEEASVARHAARPALARADAAGAALRFEAGWDVLLRDVLGFETGAALAA